MRSQNAWLVLEGPTLGPFRKCVNQKQAVGNTEQKYAVICLRSVVVKKEAHIIGKIFTSSRRFSHPCHLVFPNIRFTKEFCTRSREMKQNACWNRTATIIQQVMPKIFMPVLSQFKACQSASCKSVSGKVAIASNHSTILCEDHYLKISIKVTIRMPLFTNCDKKKRIHFIVLEN